MYVCIKIHTYMYVHTCMSAGFQTAGKIKLKICLMLSVWHGFLFNLNRMKGPRLNPARIHTPQPDPDSDPGSESESG